MRRRQIVAEIHDKDRRFVRQLVPQQSDVQLKFNETSVARLTVRDSHPVVADVMPDGMRAVVWLMTVDGNSLVKRRLLEGPVGDLSGSGPFGTVTIPVVDDFCQLGSILGWPNPGLALGGQTADYARYSGPSETRALSAIGTNVGRLGLPWDVAASAGRGTTGDTDVRFEKLSDKILDALTADRLLLSVARDAGTDRWNVSVSAGDEYSRPLTPRSGVLGSWEWVRNRPTATRVIVLGDGSGTDRDMAQVVDTSLEAATGMVLEVATDAGSAESGADLSSYGADALTDGAAKAGITATLRETTWFQFGDAYTVGTKVRIQVGAVDVEDVITEVDITHTADAGFTAVPKVGFANADPTARLVKFISDVAVSVRSLERK